MGKEIEKTFQQRFREKYISKVTGEMGYNRKENSKYL